MKTSHLVIVCLAVLLGIWIIVGHSSGSSRSKVDVRAIEGVLQADHGTSREATSVAEVVRRMEAIELSKCPADFQQAYLAHIDAWQEMVAVEQAAAQWKDRYDSGGAMVEAFLRGMVFDFGIVKESDEERNRVLAMNTQASNDIKSTFTKVKSLAVGYGARLPE